MIYVVIEYNLAVYYIYLLYYLTSVSSIKTKKENKKAIPKSTKIFGDCKWKSYWASQ